MALDDESGLLGTKRIKEDRLPCQGDRLPKIGSYCLQTRLTLKFKQDWDSTYSDLGKWFNVPISSRGVGITGEFVPDDLGKNGNGRRRKVEPNQKAIAMSKHGQFRRAEMDATFPPPKRKADIRGDLATPPRDPRGKVCMKTIIYSDVSELT